VPPRLESVWITGDNVYVSGLDMSWNNFRIGDVLEMAGAVILNTGYPHSACWKYAARTGYDPKEYINSKEGSALRLRGIKGAVLHLERLDTQDSTIFTNDNVRILHRGTPEYNRVIQSCRPPFKAGTEVVYWQNGREMRATASSIDAYVKLLICAGRDSAKIDAKRYKRKLPDVIKIALGMPTGAIAKL